MPAVQPSAGYPSQTYPSVMPWQGWLGTPQPQLHTAARHSAAEHVQPLGGGAHCVVSAVSTVPTQSPWPPQTRHRAQSLTALEAQSGSGTPHPQSHSIPSP